MTPDSQLRAEFWKRRAPEERLLFCCARQDFSDAWLERSERIATQTDLDWTRVLAVAVLHRVAPLIYRNLSAFAALSRLVPREVVDDFRRTVVLNMREKAALASALRETLEWFNRLGVDVLIVKGTSLDVVLWEATWLTSSQDIDLVLVADWEDFDEAAQQRILAMNVARPLVDVHCRQHADLVMNGLLDLDFGSMVGRASRIDVQEQPALVMCVEDELLCACVQSFRKRFFRLKSVCEIAELVERNPNLDWDALTGRAVAQGCGGIVFAALLAAHVGHGCALPVDLASRLKVSAPTRAMVRSLVKRLSATTLDRLYVDRWARGKMLGRGLLLPYASLGARKLWHSARIVSAQASRGSEVRSKA